VRADVGLNFLHDISTVPEFYEIKFWNCRNDEVKSAL
jgi:hypothetical protein